MGRGGVHKKRGHDKKMFEKRSSKASVGKYNLGRLIISSTNVKYLNMQKVLTSRKLEV